jgi:AcrR family transcriptional regulator
MFQLVAGTPPSTATPIVTAVQATAEITPSICATICSLNTELRRVGRPPGPHNNTLDKLLPVARRLLIDEGGASLTPTRLHKETGIARATIYRNWPEPADLIEIMLGLATQPPPTGAFSGDLQADLYVAVDLLLDQFERRPAQAFFAACMEYGRHSKRVATAADAFVAAILAPFRTVVEAGLETGSIDGEVDELVSELAGPLVLEHVVMGRMVTQHRGRRVADHFLDHHVRS